MWNMSPSARMVRALRLGQAPAAARLPPHLAPRRARLAAWAKAPAPGARMRAHALQPSDRTGATAAAPPAAPELERPPAAAGDGGGGGAGDGGPGGGGGGVLAAVTEMLSRALQPGRPLLASWAGSRGAPGASTFCGDGGAGRRRAGGGAAALDDSSMSSSDEVDAADEEGSEADHRARLKAAAEAAAARDAAIAAASAAPSAAAAEELREAAAALQEAARWRGPVEGELDVARDPGLMLRLMDVLTFEPPTATAGGGGPPRPASPGVVADVVVGDSRARMRGRPPAFCANCCAPLEKLPSGGDAACGACGHRGGDDGALLPPRPAGGWGSADAAAAIDGGVARAAVAAAARSAAALGRAAGLPGCPPARVLLAWHEDMLLHRAMLPPYPERPERLHAVLARLQESGLLDICDRMPVEEASDAALLAVHSPGLVAAIDALSPDTAFAEQLDISGVAACLAPESLGNRHTGRAARLAAGAAAGMAARLARGEADAGFALVRPAGHLSSECAAEGGNLYNNAAVAARAAQAAGAERVLILDWDAHAAKGTADIFMEDASVMVISMHKAGSWFYPGSSPLSQVGRGAASGTNVNIAWAAPPRGAGAGGRRGGGGGEALALDEVQPGGGDYLAALAAVVLPLAREWAPDVILVSAGFDSAEGDPVGLGSVPPPVFAHMTSMLRALGPPVGLVLEGGYVLKQTALCTELCVRALLGERPPPLPPGASVPGPVGWNTIVRTLAVHQHFWRSLGIVSLAAAAGGGAAGAKAASGAAGAGAAAGPAALEALLASAQAGAAAEAAAGEEGEEGEEWEEDESEWEEFEEGGGKEAVSPGEWAGDTAV
ncbi:MAG: hypothetical protein J3K34DRAFT_514019 [Monoraphidium minutum]|nr:MAG: hypothetical protein J3K34DRAFT_514019 [Monoraphidium minutum]